MRGAFRVGSASADFVLDAIRDSHRHQCACDPEADPRAELSLDSTVAEWRDACDLVRTDDLGAALNGMWEIDVSQDDWRAVLEPPTERTLRDVCELIASHTRRIVASPAGYLGASCRAAGAYWAIRGFLLRAGADPAALGPSAPISDLARRFPEVFLGPISRLAPGRLPTVSIRTPWYHASFAAIGLGLLCLLGVPVLASYGPRFTAAATWTAIVLMAGGVLSTFLTARLRPMEVRFGDVATLRDLAEIIARDEAA